MSRSLFARLSRRFGPAVTDQDRRRMLKATLAASAGVLLSGPAALAGSAGRRVVVVGAGYAGLACAHELLAAGYDVAVLEARNRVGGRVLTFRDFVPGRIVEGGAELIGSNHPMWVAYADRFGLEFLDVTEDEELEFPIVLGDRRLDAAAALDLYEELEEVLASMNEDAEGIDADAPWDSPGAAELDVRTTQEWIDSAGASPLARRALEVMFTADNGVAPTRQSYLGNLAQVKGGGVERYWTESEIYRCKGGNGQLGERLAESIGAGRIVLGTAVQRIERRGRTVTVTTGAGRKMDCDDVVLAVPPSVWSRIEFRPGIPAGAVPQMGVNVKYLSAVRSRFWREGGISPDSLSDQELSMTWDGTDNQPGEGPACLTGFSGGPAAERLRGLDPEARARRCGAHLEGIYPGYAASLAGVRFMDWPGDPWAGAGYSFPAPGEVTRVGPMLAAGLRNLHFAGEHACYKFVGYMEGALSSGAAVARRLAVRDGVAAPAAGVGMGNGR